ncbi:MAG: DUF1566 domain-containing protein [Deltaproteobacteria bacterium]|nr:DUF1566 domain-containing protein [Deltaproteobacteria bacterium]
MDKKTIFRIGFIIIISVVMNIYNGNNFAQAGAKSGKGDTTGNRLYEMSDENDIGWLLKNYDSVNSSWTMLKLPDTGQRQSYTGIFGEDSDYSINPPSYTKLDANGNELPSWATEWVMVRDNVTGLIWEVKSDDWSIHDKDNKYTWYDGNPDTNRGNAGTFGNGTDTEHFIQALNDERFGGFSDWRLPSREELHSIIDYGTWKPPIDRTYFPNTVVTEYWTGDGIMDYAWIMDSVIGYSNCYDKSGSYSVRAVRGGQSGTFHNLATNGDGTVTDTSTGLMWEQKTDDGGDNNKDRTYNWEEALSWVENLNNSNYLGYSDWRLPNIKELASIVDLRRTNPSIDRRYFPNTVSSVYWSSTTTHYSPEGTWILMFDSGLIFRSTKSNSSHHVRAVRGGQ